MTSQMTSVDYNTCHRLLTDRLRHEDDPISVPALAANRITGDIEAPETAPDAEEVDELVEEGQLVGARRQLDELTERLEVGKTFKTVTGNVKHFQRALHGRPTSSIGYISVSWMISRLKLD